MKNQFNLVKFLPLIALAALFIFVFIYISYKNRPSGLSVKNLPIKPEKISDELMLFPVLNESVNQVYFYSKQNTGLYSLDLSSKTKQVLLANTAEIYDMRWSADFRKAIVRVVYDSDKFAQSKSPFLDAQFTTGDTAFYIFDLESKNLFALPKNTQDAVWLDNDKIIYNVLDTKNIKTAIKTSQYNGTNAKDLIKVDYAIDYFLGYDKNKNALYFSITPEEMFGANIEEFILSTPKLTDKIKLVEDAVLVQNMDIILYDKFESEANRTQIFDLNTGESSDSAFNLDLGLITASVNREIILGITRNNQKDQLVVIDQKKKKNYLIDESVIQDVVDNILLSSDGKTLYYTSKNILYKATLKI